MYTVQQIRQMRPADLPPECVHTLRTLCKSLGFELGFCNMVEHKESINDALREVNKLTVLNMNTRIPEIVAIVVQIPNKAEFSELLYDIIYKNQFFANVYASLYTALIQRWPNFKDEFVKHHTTYVASLSDRSEGMESRRAFTVFMCHLHTMGTLPKLFIDTALGTVLTNIESCLKDSTARSYIYEMVELLILLKPSDSETTQCLKAWSSATLATYGGLTHKIQFRMMDVLQ